MKKIPLTQKQFAIVDNDDYKYLIQFKWCAKKRPCCGYVACRTYRCHITKKDKFIYMHRLITKASTGEIVDHINHNTLDNRKCNLRICTSKQNTQNMLPSKRSNTGYKGVYYSKKRKSFITLIKIDNKRLYLGAFKLVEDAAIAYNKAASYYFKEFACLNAIPTEFILSKKTETYIANRIINIHTRNNCIDNKCGYRGVCYDKRCKKWKAYISFDNKKHHLGYYASKIEAALVYDEIASKHHKEIAHKNFPAYT